MLSLLRRFLACSAFLILAAASTFGATFTVTSTGDEPDDATADGVCHTAAGTCTLRAAIMQANATAGPDTIGFALAGPGVQTIFVTAAAGPLPAITDTVVVNGYTQPGASPNTLAIGDDAVVLVQLRSSGLSTGSNGLTINANACAVLGLDIGGFPNAGLSIDAIGGGPLGGGIVAGNFIHGSATGIFLRAPATRIGGTNPAERNVISSPTFGIAVLGNFGVGAAGDLIQGNYIGTDRTGLVSEAGTGIAAWGILVQASGFTIGGSVPGAGNLISGHGGWGIYFSGDGVSPTSGVVVKGNVIGAAADGTPLGNGLGGIDLTGPAIFNTIGGVAPGEGNVIAFNGVTPAFPYGAGVIVWNVGNAVRGNRIFGTKGLGILHAGWSDKPRGNDPGDADTGPNDYQNFPILGPVTYGATTTTVPGHLKSLANTTFDLDFYSNGCQPRPQDFAQGENYLGSIQVTTDGAGLATFNAVLPVPAPIGSEITSTATDPSGNTSELSARLVFAVSYTSSAGPPAGGTSLAISGAEFDAGSIVTIGGSPATNVTLTNPNLLTVTAPARPAGTLNDVVVTNPDGMTGRLVGGWLTEFIDVPPSNPVYISVNALVRNQISAGCGPGYFCPGNGITRAQMAVFLLRGKDGVCFVPPPATGTLFGDVPAGSFAAAWIEELAARGVTAGCGGGNYCPDSFVTRAQMAVFLIQTFRL